MVFFRLLFVNNNYIGNVVGYELNKDTYYIASIVVNDEYRKLGYGHVMFLELFNSLVGRYKYLEGHFNNNSLKLLKNLDYDVIKEYDNWEDTGKKYVHCGIKLEV